MKANDVALSPRVCRSVFQVSASPVVLGLSAVVLLMQLSQAGQKPSGVSRAGVPVAETLRLDLGTVGISSPSQPARYGSDRAIGRINYAADGAGYAARAVLNTPDMHDGTLQVLAGALGSAAAPVAAVVGGVRARNQVLSPNELSETERDLTHAMAEMAEQSQLRERILEAAKGKTRRQIVAMNAFDEAAVRMVANRPSAGSPVRTVLESKVEEIRLERAGSTDSSFALLIKARVRLLRSDNGNVLYDQPFEYRSEKGLFLDWTLNKAQPFRQCAVTGYRKLAEQIVEQVFLKTAEGPIVVGAGFKKPPARGAQSQVVLAANRGMSSVQPRPEFATRPVANLGTIGVYSTSAVSYVAVQLPMTKQKAVSEAIQDVEWSLDGLDNHPNPLVALTASAAAIPMSLYKQTAGAVRGLPDKKYRAAEAHVTAAVRKTKPDQDLAYQVAQRLTPQSSQPV